MSKYKKKEKLVVDTAREYYEINSPKPIRERLEATDLDVVDFYHDMGILRTPAEHEVMWAIWVKNGREVEGAAARFIRLEAERQIQLEKNKQKRVEAELAAVEAQKQEILNREADIEAATVAKLAKLEAEAQAERERLAAIEAKKKEILAAKSIETPAIEPEEKTIDELIDEV